MKWRAAPSAPRPFQVLPPLKMPSTLRLLTKGLGSATGTWPPKGKKRPKKAEPAAAVERPSTATLERPQLLDISLLGKIDMSLVRKEFLNMTNLCKKRPGSKPAASAASEPAKRKDLSDESLDGRPKQSRRLANDANNNTTNANSTTTTLTATNSTKKKAAGDLRQLHAARSMPEPCKACGRPDLPERLHSHPLDRPKKRPEEPRRPSPKKPPPPVKAPIQRPAPIRFRSKREDPPAASPAKSPQKLLTARSSSKREDRKPPEPARPRPASQAKTPDAKERPPRAPPASRSPPQKAPSARVESAGKGPRTVTCYLCGREFGTASLPIHEPKCLQRWERENAALPYHLRRKPPAKPSTPMTQEQWNNFAWNAAQSSLVPCKHCGRTFQPDRLTVHLRSCRPGATRVSFPSTPVPKASDTPSPSSSTASSSASTLREEGAECGDRPNSSTMPLMYICYICGRKFGSRSISIHEPQCLKKWHNENNLLPPDQRRQPPVKPDKPAIERTQARRGPLEFEICCPPEEERLKFLQQYKEVGEAAMAASLAECHCTRPAATPSPSAAAPAVTAAVVAAPAAAEKPTRKTMTTLEIAISLDDIAALLDQVATRGSANTAR